MNSKKGFKRLIWAVSILMGIIVMFYYRAQTITTSVSRPTRGAPSTVTAQAYEFVEYLFFGILAAGLVWVIYFVILYIIRGFKDENY